MFAGEGQHWYCQNLFIWTHPDAFVLTGKMWEAASALPVGVCRPACWCRGAGCGLSPGWGCESAGQPAARWGPSRTGAAAQEEPGLDSARAPAQPAQGLNSALWEVNRTGVCQSVFTENRCCCWKQDWEQSLWTRKSKQWAERGSTELRGTAEL